MKASIALAASGLSLVVAAPTTAQAVTAPQTSAPTMSAAPTVIAAPAKKKCWNLGKRTFGSSAYGGPRLRCIKEVTKRKHYVLYSARAIRMPVYKRANTATGTKVVRYKRHNRKGTKVWIREYKKRWVFKWRSNRPKQKWTGRLTYSGSERIMKFYYLKGSKSGRIYEG